MQEQLSLHGLEPVHFPANEELTYVRGGTEEMDAITGRLITESKQAPVLKEERDAWPLRIYTLGRFSLLVNGQPVDFGRKVPHRPLEMLKALVALGGRGVGVAGLSSELWPDAEGDAAQRSFDTTLHRLRKIIGDDRVLVLKDGKLSLDSRYCRVDVWDFERLLGRVQRILNRDSTGRAAFILDVLTERMLGLYQDHFLAKENAMSWSISIRERLRVKYIHNLLGIGRYWEEQGLWDRAMQCYQKGLEVDDLVEVFYQRLMACSLETYRISEGMAAYRRCKEILSVVLGLQPEAKSESLYRALLSARSEQQRCSA